MEIKKTVQQNREAALYRQDNVSDDAKKAAHTPGPWKVIGAFTVKMANQDEYICSAALPDESFHPDGRSAERAANARLIAAAPDLLAALEDMTAFLSNHGYDERYEFFKSARAAILRATEGR